MSTSESQSPAPGSALPQPLPERTAQVLVLQQAPQIAEEVTLADGIRFLHRSRWILLGWAAGFGLFGAAAAFILIKPEYEASATLVVNPPSVDSKIAPRTLTVQGYQKLIESDAVVREVRQRIADTGVPLDELPALGSGLSTAIFVSKRDEGISLAPMLQLNARNGDGEVAARIANTWTEVFFARVHTMNAGTTDSSVAFVDQQFQQMRERLVKAESARTTAADDIQAKRAALVLEWDRKVADTTQAHARNKAAYQDESRRLVERFQAEKNLANRQAIMESSRKAMQDLQGEIIGINARLDQRRLELASAKTRLSSTPQNLITRRAISDDAVWQALAGGTMSPEQRQRFLDQGMIAENPNPAWTDLTTRVANLEIDLAALAPREERLRADIQSKSERLKDDEALLRADIAAFSELQRGREVGLAALVENQELSLAALKRDRDIAIQGFARQSDLRLAILDRELVQAKGLYDQFAKHQSEAQIAKAQENRQDVQLATPAVAPDRPESAKRGLIAVAAVFAGLMLGLCHAVVRGALRTGR